MTTLFDFQDPNALLRKATKASTQRRSGTVAETVKHSIIHTPSPSATLHHCIIAAAPHPIRQRADEGEHYMVAYISIPLNWLPALDQEFARRWDVSFLGPAGQIQKLPPTLLDMEPLIQSRVYVGFDWMWLPTNEQPGYGYIKDKLVKFITELRKGFDSDYVPETEE
jgi:hypothetical protein